MAVDIVIQETIDLVDITVNPNIIEVNVTRTSGGGGSQTLAQTLDLGNQTGGENILINDADAIELENGSSLKKGTYDFGGDGGISRICSVDYEDMWQAGIRHVFDNNGLIRHSTNCFDVVPDSSFDNTLRFKIDSLWTLDNGTTYKCTDASTGAAVWELYDVGGIPTLQEVLDNNADLVDGNFIAGTQTYGDKPIGTNVISIGADTGTFADGDDCLYLGYSAGTTQSGNFLNAIGSNSGANNSGNECNAIGADNLIYNSGDFVNALGTSSLQNNTANYVNAFGKSCGSSNAFKNVNLFGFEATADAENQTVFSKWISGVTKYLGRLSFNNITADRKWELQDADGTLAFLSDITGGGGGGASISFYLNGSVSQGTIGGVAFREMDRTPILGAGTDFTINANGYIQSFITDANVPNLLEIPAGNWNFETYFSASSNGGSPSFYVELYKWDGTTLSLIASNSANPEFITGGVNTDLYVSALAVPQTTLLATDRLAIRIYVTHSGRTIKLHTENSNLCQVITTFSTGLTALNGLTAQVQNLATGTTGTDFGIVSSASTHTFNLPNASAANRGLLTSSDWSTFNSKLSDAAFQFTRRLIANGSGSVTGTTAETILTSLTIPANTLDSKCFIWSTMDFFKSSAGLVTVRLYINTTNSLSGATLIGFTQILSNRNLSFNRKLYLNGTTLDFLTGNTAATQVSNEFIEAIVGASTTLTVNPANDIFLIYTTQNDAVGTTGTNKIATVQKLKLN